MKKVEVLGPGCYRCEKLFENLRSAVMEAGIECGIEKVTDIGRITSYGVMITPALVVDGKIITAGKVLSPNEIKKILTE